MQRSFDFVILKGVLYVSHQKSVEDGYCRTGPRAGVEFIAAVCGRLRATASRQFVRFETSQYAHGGEKISFQEKGWEGSQRAEEGGWRDGEGDIASAAFRPS